MITNLEYIFLKKQMMMHLGKKKIQNYRFEEFWVKKIRHFFSFKFRIYNLCPTYVRQYLTSMVKLYYI